MLRIFGLVILTTLSAMGSTWDGSSGGSAFVRSWSDADLAVVPTNSAVPRITSSGSITTNAAVQGRVTKTQTGATTVSDYQVAATVTGTLNNLTYFHPTYTSVNGTGTATINAVSGYLTMVTPGTVTATLNAEPFGTWPQTLTLTSTTASTTYFSNWSSGLMPMDMNSEIDSLIAAAGTFSSGAENLYSSANDTTGSYVRNTSVWTGSVNLTAIPTWSSAQFTGNGGVVGFIGTLITPTDVLVAQHIAPSAGTTYRFTDNSNNTYTATIGSTVNVNGDLSVSHIASWSSGSKPSSISVMPVLPSNYEHYCPDYNLNFFPIICTNQFRQVFVQDSVGVTLLNGGTNPILLGQFYHYPATETNRSPWTLNVIGGDSSEPIMTIINGQAVVIGANHTAINCPSVGDNISGINSALATLDAGGTVYTLTTVPTSGFTATTNNGNVTSFPTY